MHFWRSWNSQRRKARKSIRSQSDDDDVHRVFTKSPTQCYRMFNPNTGRVILMRDIIWLGWMYYPRLNTKVTQLSPIVVVPVMQ